MVFDCSEEGEEVFFELQANEFFRTEVAVGFGAGRMLGVPCLGDGLREEVNPAAVGSREGKSGAERGGGDGYG